MGHGGCVRWRAAVAILPFLTILLLLLTSVVSHAEDTPPPAPAQAAPAAAEKPSPPAPVNAKEAPQAEPGKKPVGEGANREAPKAKAPDEPAAEMPADKPAAPVQAPNRLRPLPGQIQMRGAAVQILRQGVRINGTNEVVDDEPVFFPADRATLQRLAKAQELLEQKRYGEAVRLLGDILEGPEDFFFQPKRDEPVHRSLKAEAQRLIGELSGEGRAAYELQYGAAAQQKLDQAIADGDAALLAEISRRFFHTKAGYEATALLAEHHRNHGRPLAAALCLKRLVGTPGAADFEPLASVKMAACWQQAGLVENARETLAQLATQNRADAVLLGGKRVPLPRRGDDGLAWLTQVVGVPSVKAVDGNDQWTMYRGSPSRNTISTGSSPLLSRRWGVRTADENGGAVETTINQLSEAAQEQGGALLCSLHPLAVKNHVFMRSVSGLVAIDFTTGKRVWRIPVDESIRQLLEPGATLPTMNQTARIGNGRLPMNQAAAAGSRWLGQRLWEDATYGTMSSDGERVFCVEDLDLGIAAFEQRRVVLPNGRLAPSPAGPSTYNRLAAYDIATEGKLKWEAGGAPGETASELAGGFFLGPPLPLADSVYALVEIKGEIRVVALDAATGKIEWSQQLAVLESSAGSEHVRRTAGVSPSYSDGILVCPTAAGAVVALDLTTRSLLWGYQYARNEIGVGAAGFGGVGLIRNPPLPAGGVAASARWVDASATIAGGQVLLTPPESNQLHCLNLLDGKLLWQKSRDDGLYIGCVHNGEVLVVGRHNVRAVGLADGEPTWDEGGVALPVGSSPSGRGFFNGQRYHLPLSSAEVAAIDLATGQIVSRAKSRDGTVPGNLICYQGAVISQNIKWIERFDQQDDLWQQINTAIAAAPDDAGALARRGELLLDDGKLTEAIGDLRRSYKLNPDPRTREILVEALLEGLRVDFAAHRDQLAEIEALLEQPQQRGAFLRLVAAGWQSLGELPAAFTTYLRIADLDRGNNDLERVDRTLSVRRDHWVQARLQDLLASAKPTDRSEMERTIRGRFRDAQQEAGPGALRRFLGYFGTLPIADEARELLAARLIEEGSPGEAEQLLRRLENSSDPQVAARATARYARLLTAVHRDEEAAIYYRRLAERFGDIPCDDGKTGSAIASNHPSGAALTWLTSPNDVWPIGKVEREETKGQAGMSVRHFALDLSGPLGPFYEYATVGFDQQQQALLGVDGIGHERWRVSLRDAAQNGNPFGNGQLNPARVSGHIVVVSLASQILAIDTLGSPGNEGAKVLWRTPALAVQPQLHQVQVPWAAPRLVPADATGRPLGSLGPVTAERTYFQRMRSVTAVRTTSGESLWVRSDTEPGSDIFGDDELIFIAPPGGEEALVVRALDGMELGRRKVPTTTQRMLTLGRRALSWNIENGKVVMRLTDCWEGKELWQRQVDIAAKAWLVRDEAVGVMTPDGSFVLLDLADGHPLVEEKVAAEPQLSEIYVLRGPDQYVLATNRPPRNANGITRQPVTGGAGNPLISGHIHLFDRRTGKRINSTPVDRHGLLLSQPAALPVLTFATHVYDQRKNRSHNVEAEVVFVDKRTGRMVHDERLKHPIASVDVTGDPARHQVIMKTQGVGMSLTFTGKPLPGAEGEAAGEESEAQRAGKAVLRGFEKWFRGMAPQSIPAEPGEK